MDKIMTFPHDHRERGDPQNLDFRNTDADRVFVYVVNGRIDGHRQLHEFFVEFFRRFRPEIVSGEWIRSSVFPNYWLFGIFGIFGDAVLVCGLLAGLLGSLLDIGLHCTGNL